MDERQHGEVGDVDALLREDSAPARFAFDWIDGTLIFGVSFGVGFLPLSAGTRQSLIYPAVLLALIGVPWARRKLFGAPARYMARPTSLLGALSAVLTFMGMLTALLGIVLLAHRTPGPTPADDADSVAFFEQRLAQARIDDAAPKDAWRITDAQRELALAKGRATDDPVSQREELRYLWAMALGGALAFFCGVRLDRWLTVSSEAPDQLPLAG